MKDSEENCLRLSGPNLFTNILIRFVILNLIRIIVYNNVLYSAITC
jgi:hypothetical protein